ncbi:MAG: restriction endonuclease subunit S [Collinsella aerofaciens]|nr:restriction endonuclease subunit S [Collinsella aerofaciens]
MDKNNCGKPQFSGEWVKLGDVASYINGYAFKPTDYASEGKPIIRIQDLTGNAYQTNRFAGNLDDKYRVVWGDVLISWSASLGVYVWSAEEAWLNQHIFKVQFNKLPVNKRFFIHQTRYVIAESATLAHGATMRHLTKKVFDNLPFFYPSEHDQDEIACHLDGIQLQIDSASEMLARLDTLVKSRFIEMFGGLGSDGLRSLKDVCSIITDGTHQPPKFVDEGIPFLFVSNIASDAVDYETNKFISVEDYEQLIRRTPIEIGDVLVSAVGSFGHPAVVRNGRPFCFQRHIAYLKPRHDLVDSNYLHAVLLSDEAQRYMDRCAKGVAQRTVTLKSFREMKIPVPPMSLQEEFAAFVQYVDKLRFDVQQQIDKLELLKNSLMQEYFG